jgi:hypothetical protein
MNKKEIGNIMYSKNLAPLEKGGEDASMASGG